MIRVALCDDHAMVRRGVRETLVECTDMVVAAEASSYAEIRDILRTKTCDVLVLDLNLPGRSGLEVVSSLRESHNPIRILILSMYPEDQYALRCLRAGADGYLNKADDPAKLIAAVRTLAGGKKYITPETSEMLIASLNAPPETALHASLSERELQTLLKIASGKRLSDIAQELMLSPKTVSVYRARLLEKLNLSNNAELTVYAIRNGLV